MTDSNTQTLNDIINHQKAEIERYKGVIKLLEDDVASAQNNLDITERMIEDKNKFPKK